MPNTTALDQRPLLTAALGALCIASSGVLVRLASSTPETVAFFRCAYALPVLGLITYFEKKRLGPLPARSRNLGWIAGAFFVADLVFWHNAIDAVGAGLATVLGNMQVLIVGFVAWLLLKERPSRTLFLAIPVMVVGVVLISGVTGGDPYGENPGLGVALGLATSVAYSGFILVLREGSRDLQRIAGPLFHATLAAAILGAGYGAITGTIDWTPAMDSQGWLALLALTAQVAGWLLISRSLPRLPAAVTSVVLLLQPVAAMVLAAIIVDERPGAAQLLGAVLILGGVVVATSGHRGKAAEPETQLI